MTEAFTQEEFIQYMYLLDLKFDRFNIAITSALHSFAYGMEENFLVYLNEAWGRIDNWYSPLTEATIKLFQVLEIGGMSDEQIFEAWLRHANLPAGI